MESLGKDHAYSESSLPRSAAHEDYAVPGNVETTLKEFSEREENDLCHQWFLKKELIITSSCLGAGGCAI